MANALGRISGQLLKNNLTRNGQDLVFDDLGTTDPVLKLNVTNRYISINSDTTLRDLFVSEKIRTTNLISVDRLNDPLDASPLKLSISGTTIVSRDNLNLSAATQVNANIIDTDNIRIDGNVISTKTLNTTLDFTPAGSLDIYNVLNVNGNLRAWDSGPGTGNITLDGNITFGSIDQSGTNADTISFAADINTDINPNLNDTYRLGTDTPSLDYPNGKRWEGLYTELINGEQATTLGLSSSGVNLVLRPGKSWYVAANGLDTNVGDHQNGAFATIKHALDESSAGDTVYIYPGTYTEIFPLTVKVGVAVKGAGIRSVTVQPTVGTQTYDAFLLNGESTVSDLTVKDFYAPGYAFAFAPGFTVSSRSPYVQNITVITKGSVTSTTDPRGFDQGDAGGGARVDGSLATSASKEASMLFHSVTFITPGVDALVMTNGVRVEWLNSFTYFANRGLYATQGTLGLASLGIRFGAEIRSIGSANVYGNYGAEANGASTLMYLIQHNFAYIGAGKDVTNDPSLNIPENETVELAAGKIYYQSLDNKGNFNVGDAFGVSFETGLVEISGVSVSAGGISSINFTNGLDETHVDATNFHTGNVKFSDNLLTTLAGAINLDSGTNEIKLNADTDVTNNLDIIGNFNVDGTLTIGNAFIDIVRFTAPVEFDLRPKTDDDFTLGGPTNKRWDFVYLDTSYIGNYKLENATISTVAGSADVELRADGTGRIFVNQDNVEFDQDLTVNGTTNLKNTVIGTGTAITQVSQNLSGTSSPTGFFFYGWQILNPGQTVPTFSVIQPGWTVVGQPTWIVSVVGDGVTNYDITITGGVFASGGTYSFTGPIPSNITHVGDYYQTGNTLQTGNRTITGTLDVTNNIYFDNINIVDNRIFTTNSNDDLELRAVGLGIVVFNDNTQFSQAALFGTLVTNGLTNSGTITSDIFTNGDIEINDNYITTTVGNNDLRLVPNGTGKVSIPLDPVLITQALTVEDDAILKNVAINGDLDHLGNTTQTGNVVQTGNFELSTDLTVTGTDAFFTDIRIINNRIATSTGSNNLELRANGTGIIKIADSAAFGQTLTVNGITTTSTLSTVTGTITSDIFSDGDIEINDNYITTTVGNNNLILAGNTTGGPKLEQIKFNASTISTETTNQGFTLTVPTGGVIINAATALKVPVGTTVDRSTLTQGEFRFNSTDNLFRGYSTSTVSFAGVYSADRRTSVLAHPTNNTLLFTTNTLNNMTVSATGLTVNSFTVDNNITFATNIISTAVTNNDLFLTPNGLGKVVIDDISLLNNEIINSSNTALVLQNTGSGYVKFGGTGGIALPAGPTVGDTSGIELGDLRYNTDLSIPEIFNGVAYVGFVSESAALLTAAEVQEITNLWALVIG